MPEFSRKDIIDTLSSRSFFLRDIKIDDAEKLEDFYSDLSERSKKLFTPHAFDREALQKECLRFTGGGKDRGFVLCDKDDRIAAYFFLWHIDTDLPEAGIAIVDRCHGQGLGRLLMNFLISEGKELGKKQLRLTTGLDNDNAFHLYESCGFVYTGIIEYPCDPGQTPFRQREMIYTY